MVLDASVVLEMLLGTRHGVMLTDRLLTGKRSLHVPHLLDVEVAHVLRRYERTKEITPARGAEALADLVDLPLERHPHDMLLPRIWNLRDNLTGYDAAYVALAEGLDATLLTRDRKLASGRSRVEVV